MTISWYAVGSSVPVPALASAHRVSKSPITARSSGASRQSMSTGSISVPPAILFPFPPKPHCGGTLAAAMEKWLMGGKGRAKRWSTTPSRYGKRIVSVQSPRPLPLLPMDIKAQSTSVRLIFWANRGVVRCSAASPAATSVPLSSSSCCRPPKCSSAGPTLPMTCSGSARSEPAAAAAAGYVVASARDKFAWMARLTTQATVGSRKACVC